MENIFRLEKPYLLNGRRKIFTDYDIINSDNVVEVLRKALLIHDLNRLEIEYLMNYESGIQPIIKRVKNVRPEINEKVVVNNASLITDFKIGYEFGTPIKYVQKDRIGSAKNQPETDDIRISALNSMLSEVDKSSVDLETVRDFKICGIGYQMIKAKKDIDGISVFDVLRLDPMTTFVVYSSDVYHKPIMAVSYRKKDNGITEYACYTYGMRYNIEIGIENSLNIDSNNSLIKNGNGNGEINIPAIIPIVEFQNNQNRQGCFEKVIPILDAINVSTSDRVNDISQHVQSLLWMHNCELPTDKEGNPIPPTKDGLIQTSTPNGQNNTQANIKYVEQPLDQSQTQCLVDDLKKNVMEITGIPQRQDNSGGSTGSAMSLSSGWQMAETLAQTSDLTFDKSEKQCIRIMIEILKVSTEIQEEYRSIKELKISDIDIKHPRNKNFDLNTKVNALVAMLKAGVHPLDAIKVVCLFDDPQQVWMNSKEMIKKVQDSQINDDKNQEPSSDGNKANPDRTIQDGSDQPQKSNFTI